MGKEVLTHAISFEIRPQHIVLPHQSLQCPVSPWLRPRRAVLGNIIGQEFMKTVVLSTLPPFSSSPSASSKAVNVDKTWW